MVDKVFNRISSFSSRSKIFSFYKETKSFMDRYGLRRAPEGTEGRGHRRAPELKSP